MPMWKIWCWICVVVVCPLMGELADVVVQAEAAVLMNAETGVILYEKNGRTRLYPSSITKVATALYALDQQGHKLQKVIVADQECIGWTSAAAKKRSDYTLPAHWQEIGGTHMSLKKGEELSLEALLYGLMLVSANDAANVIAQYIGGTVPDFMRDLNLYLQEIGCEDTHFCNPHGLHHPKHQTTAYDMAVMTRKALADPQFRKIVSTTRYPRPKTNHQEEGVLIQSNRLLKRGKHHYSKAIGVKTGSTKLAQNCLVSAATHQGRTLIAVLMKSKDRDPLFEDTINLFETAFRQAKEKQLIVPEGLLQLRPILPGASGQVYPYIQEPIHLEYFLSEKPQIKCVVDWEDLTLPITRDQKIATLVVKTTDERLLHQSPVYSRYRVDRSVWERTKSFFRGEEGRASPFLKSIGFCLIGALILGLLFQLRSGGKG